MGEKEGGGSYGGKVIEGLSERDEIFCTAEAMFAARS